MGGMRLVGRRRWEGYFTTVGIFESANVRCGVYYYLAVGGGGRGEGDAARGSKLCHQTRSGTAVGDCCLVGEAVACWNCSFKTTVILNSAGSEVRVCVVLDRLEEQFVELCCEVFVC